MPIEQELPYGENNDSFDKWFRTEAKVKWEKYLNGDERDITIQERDVMRNFLIESGTQTEIDTKLQSFGLNFGAMEALQNEIKSTRGDIKFDINFPKTKARGRHGL